MNLDLALAGCWAALVAAVVWTAPDWRPERANRTGRRNLRLVGLAAVQYASGAGAFRELLAAKREQCARLGCAGCRWDAPFHPEPPEPSPPGPDGGAELGRALRRRVADHVVRARPPW